VLLACSCTIRETAAFVVPPLSLLPLPRSELSAIYTPGRSSSSSPRSGKNNHNNNERSKRQFRVGELVRKELATILHNGIIKGRDATYLEEDLRKRISIVSVDVSPDLRQARVCVSIRNGGPKPSVNNHNGSGSNNVNGNGNDNGNGENNNNNSNNNYSNYYHEDDPVVEKRRAFSWLVDNSGSLKHTLAQKLSHMKTSSPNLTFHQVDVAAATDVMYLIDKVSKGYKRDESSVSELHEFLGGGGESDDDHDDDEDYFLDEDDDDWDEMDDDFFETE